jgi:methylglutaconyl-CoA hydratase
MTTELVKWQFRNPAAILTLNRSEKRNALSRDLIAQLYAAFERARDDDAVRCVILTATGSSFCAGMDLDELQDVLGENKEIAWDDAEKLAKLFDLIYTLPKPTIAAVNGTAVAGGAGLVTVCDLAVSVQSAKFGYPEVRRGLVAALVLPHLLRHVGERTARWLLLTGEMMEAAAAMRVGLINQVVHGDMLMDSAMSWARSISEGGPRALATTKSLLRQMSSQTMSIEELAKASATPRLGEECQEGLRTFFEKRPAPWIK